MFKKYKWNFISVILLVSVTGFIIFDIIFYYSIKNYLFDQTFNEMKMKSQLAVKLIENKNLQSLYNNKNELYNIVYQIRNIVNSRITIIDSSGQVLTDSDVNREKVQFMDNHINRPEIQEAIIKSWGQSYRKSNTVNRKIFYTAFSLKYQKKIIGFIRLSYYAQHFAESMKKIVTLIIAANLIGLFILFGISLISCTIATRPILKIVSTAKQISNGHLEKTFANHRKDEIGTLSSILNQLIEHLKSQIAQISDERTKLKHILTNLDIGIIVIDQNKKILHANPAIFRILELKSFEIKDVNVAEIIRSEQLINSINMTLKNATREKGEFISYTLLNKKFLRYMITPFSLIEGKITGVLIQLQDETELKKLEAIRRDFVANASHELKTPLTAIIGYTDTLIEGAADKPTSRLKFIRKIREQSQRLEFLVSDLLKLSELERELPLKLSPALLRPIIKEIIEEFDQIAKKKSINISLESPENIKVKVDKENIRIVFHNLVDNAIKYTSPDGKVYIRVTEVENNRIKIEVIDTGIGIDKKYHNRIFQRFYRIDKSRSSTLGETGLGLAIVKHIIDRHGSTIMVQSELGKGSCFWFELVKA